LVLSLPGNNANLVTAISDSKLFITITECRYLSYYFMLPGNWSCILCPTGFRACTIQLFTWISLLKHLQGVRCKSLRIKYFFLCFCLLW
jgi:hypothetical protein